MDINNYAYHSRYPDGIGKSSHAQDLICPKCGDGRIGIVEEVEFDGPMMLGDLARCWLCKHEFRITENCWKWRTIKNST